MTTDKVVLNRSSKILEDALGIRHYAILVEEIPPNVARESYDPKPPFLVKLCELCDAYDKATGWRDFRYPTWTAAPSEEFDGHPTCARCSGA